MSRTLYIVGIALLFVAGTIVFVQRFGSEPGPNAKATADLTTKPAKSGSGSNWPHPHGISRSRASFDTKEAFQVTLPASVTRSLTPEEQLQVDLILQQTRTEARQEIDRLAEKLELSSRQQARLFPLAVAHHPQAHPSMLVGGNPLPSVDAGQSLEASVFSELEPSQQDEMTEAALDDDAWWDEVIGQFEDDLDQAIATGEIAPSTEEPQTTIDDTPADGHGEESSHSGGNLFDLIGQ